MNSEVEQFWKEIHSYANEDKALTHIFRKTNKWLYASKFALLNEMLLFDPSKEKPVITLAFITISRWAPREIMTNLKPLYESADKHFRSIYPEEKAIALLKGLD